MSDTTAYIAIRNCQALAAQTLRRIEKGIPVDHAEKWAHILRFCDEAIGKPSILRETALPSVGIITEPAPQGASNEAPPLHSPLPWLAAFPEVDAEECIKAIVAKDDRYHESTRTICVVGEGNGYPTDPEDDDATDVANARFILRACNAHYELVEALKACAEVFDSMDCLTWIGDDDVNDPSYEEAQGLTTAALAKAEGEGR